MPADPRPRPCPRPFALALILAVLAGCDGPPPSLPERAALIGHAREVTSIAFAPDGKTLASRGGDAVKLWDLAGSVEVASLAADGSEFGSVAFSPDGQTLAATLPARGAVAWDVASRREKATYSHPPRPASPSSGTLSYGWGLAYSPDGATLAGGGSNGGQDGFVTLWDVATGRGTDLGSHRSPVASLAFSPDGKALASKSMGGAIEVWDLATRAERAVIRSGPSYLAPVCFSTDGRALASAGDDRRIKLWDVATGDQLKVLKGHTKAVLSAAFHPGGNALASGDAGGTVFVWDLATQSPIARLTRHQGKVWAVAFSPDGKILASAGEDRSIRLWDVSKAVGGLRGGR